MHFKITVTKDGRARRNTIKNYLNKDTELVNTIIEPENKDETETFCLTYRYTYLLFFFNFSVFFF